MYGIFRLMCNMKLCIGKKFYFFTSKFSAEKKQIHIHVRESISKSVYEVVHMLQMLKIFEDRSNFVPN